MILGGGIIRSGGKTKYVMMIDMMGTWLNFGAPRLGIAGAAYASVISQAAGALISFWCFYRLYGRIRISLSLGKAGYSQYFMMLLPIVLNEFFWSVVFLVRGTKRIHICLWAYGD